MTQPSEVIESHSEQRIVDGSGLPDNIIINNCHDVHIGPKYVHNNTININQGLPCVDKYDDCEVEGKSPWSVIHKCLSVPYGVHLKTLLLGSSFLLTVLVIVIVISLKKHSPTVRPILQLGEDIEDYPLDKKFVMRDAWGAAPPCTYLPNLTLPVERVVFIHTAGSGTCNNFNKCKSVVLDIQDMHRNDCEGAVGDIGYNFVIGSDGHIFVGRGWDKIGAHTYGTNNGSIGVAFVGDFRRDEPSPAMLDAAKTLLEVGVQRGKLSEDYQLIGHCQCRYHNFPYSPGVNILKKIEFWPHWNNTDWKYCAKFVPSNS